MGYDPPGERHSACRPGTTRFGVWLQDRYQGGSYGCFNPASTVGNGTPSLHADGRAFDLALNAKNHAERARGDRCFDELVAHHEAFGLQEIIWRDRIWSYKNRHLGVRQSYDDALTASHQDHVHIGQDRATADVWDVDDVPAALGGMPAPSPQRRTHMLVDENEETGQGWLIGFGGASQVNSGKERDRLRMKIGQSKRRIVPPLVLIEDMIDFRAWDHETGKPKLVR